MRLLCFWSHFHAHVPSAISFEELERPARNYLRPKSSVELSDLCGSRNHGYPCGGLYFPGRTSADESSIFGTPDHGVDSERSYSGRLDCSLSRISISA